MIFMTCACIAEPSSTIFCVLAVKTDKAGHLRILAFTESMCDKTQIP